MSGSVGEYSGTGGKSVPENKGRKKKERKKERKKEKKENSVRSVAQNDLFHARVLMCVFSVCWVLS
jgi:hypothetical protein